MTMEENKKEDLFDGPDHLVPDEAGKVVDKKTMQLILRQIPIDFWARDARHRRVVFQSDQSIATWGDLRGTAFDDSSIPPELVAKWDKGFDNAMEGKTIHHEGVFPGDDGRDRVFRKSFSPVRDDQNKILGVLGVFVDITEQREKERLLTSRRKLAEQLNKTSDCNEAFQYCFETAIRVSHVSLANLYVMNESGVGTLLFQHGNAGKFLKRYSTLYIDEPIRRAAVQKKTLIRTPSDLPVEVVNLLSDRTIGEIAHLPLCHGENIVALLSVSSTNFEKFPQWCIAELETIVSQTEATIARIRTQDKLASDRSLLRQLLQMQEQERQLLSSEIHDGFVQDVVGAQMVLEAAMQTCAHHSSSCTTLFDQAGMMLNRAIKEARRLISDLRPLIIEEAGVVEAINFLVDRAKASSKMTILYTHDPVIERFDPILEGVVFRIIQEAINNALRHSQGTQVKVNLTENNKILTIKVLDDGVGFDPARVPENRFGIRGITERATLFDGTAKIKSHPGQGTKIIIKLPIARLKNPRTQN